MRDSTPVGRRTVLASSVALGAGLAGCLGQGSTADDETGETPTDAGRTQTNAGEDEEDLADFGIDHPIAVGAENDPVLGPPPDEAEMGMFLVSEPSCPYCRDFNEEIWEPMKTELIEPGRMSLVYRPYPKVRDWATEAAYGMLETYDRDEDAFLPLKEYLYANFVDVGYQTSQKIADFLNETTDVDGDAVKEVIDTRERVDDLVETMDAVRAADMTTVPSYAIVKEGEVTTTATGGQSWENIKRMLGVD